MTHEVDLHVQRAKFNAEVAAFERSSPVTRERGCHLLSAAFPNVHLVLVKNIQFGEHVMPAVLVSVQVNFMNYDLDAPSVLFVDVVTRAPSRPWCDISTRLDNGIEQSFIGLDHPVHGRPFICHPGIREYHEHPEHAGTPWRLTREQGQFVGLVWLSDFLWTHCVDRFIGFQVGFAPVFQPILKPPG